MASRFNYTYRYIDDVLSIKIQSLRITLARCILLNLRSKTRQRATLLLLTRYFWSIGRDGQLHTSIYDKRDDFISISQTYRSWVAIYQLRPSMASLSHSLYDMPGLAPRMDILSCRRHDFQISFSNRDTSRNAWNRHSGLLLNNMKLLSHECSMTFCSLTKYNGNHPLITFYTRPWFFFTEVDLLLTYERFP